MCDVSPPGVSRPYTRFRPLSGLMSRLYMRNVVVFPQPEGQMRTQVSPSLISRVRSRTALEPLANCLLTFSRWIKFRLPYPNDRRPIPRRERSVGRLELAQQPRADRAGRPAAARRAEDRKSVV